MISTSRPTITGALWTLCATALLDPAAALAQRNAPPQNIVVDSTPSHVVSSFSPFRSLGAGIDRLRGDITDKVMAQEFRCRTGASAMAMGTGIRDSPTEIQIPTGRVTHT